MRVMSKEIIFSLNVTHYLAHSRHSGNMVPSQPSGPELSGTNFFYYPLLNAFTDP